MTGVFFFQHRTRAGCMEIDRSFLEVDGYGGDGSTGGNQGPLTDI